jgi:hypothetical protein
LLVSDGSLKFAATDFSFIKYFLKLGFHSLLFLKFAVAFAPRRFYPAPFHVPCQANRGHRYPVFKLTAGLLPGHRVDQLRHPVLLAVQPASVVHLAQLFRAKSAISRNRPQRHRQVRVMIEAAGLHA